MLQINIARTQVNVASPSAVVDAEKER